MAIVPSSVTSRAPALGGTTAAVRPVRRYRNRQYLRAIVTTAGGPLPPPLPLSRARRLPKTCAPVSIQRFLRTLSTKIWIINRARDRQFKNVEGELSYLDYHKNRSEAPHPNKFRVLRRGEKCVLHHYNFWGYRLFVEFSQLPDKLGTAPAQVWDALLTQPERRAKTLQLKMLLQPTLIRTSPTQSCQWSKQLRKKQLSHCQSDLPHNLLIRHRCLPRRLPNPEREIPSDVVSWAPNSSGAHEPGPINCPGEGGGGEGGVGFGVRRRETVPFDSVQITDTRASERTQTAPMGDDGVRSLQQTMWIQRADSGI